MPEFPDEVEELSENIELAADVVQLNNAQLTFITKIDEENTNISFHSTLPFEYLPKEGQILLQLTPTDKLPYGFAGRVTRVMERDGCYVVETEAPTLIEIFNKLYSDGQMRSLDGTRALATDGEGYYMINHSIGKVFENKGITLKGSYNAGFRPRQRLTIDKAKEQSDILFEFDTKNQTNITVVLSPDLSHEGVKDIGKGVILTLTAGGLPIATCLQPYLTLSANANNGVNLDVALKEENTYRIESVGGLVPKVQRVKESFSLVPSCDVSTKISAECFAGVGMRVEFRLFGRADMAIGVGPEVGFKASGEVGVDLVEDGRISNNEYELLKDNCATITGAARLSAYADASAFNTKKWYQTLAEVEFNKKTYYLLPTFDNAFYTTEYGTVNANATVGRDLLFEVNVGIAAWNGDKPTYGDAYSYRFEQEFVDNPISDNFSEDDQVEYWTYVKLGGSYVKGVKLKDEDDELRQMLIKFYHDTGGDNWICNDNWCSDKDINQWYGVDNRSGLSVRLSGNNLTGNGDLSGCTELQSLDCYNNQLTSLDVSGCTALGHLDCYNNQLSSLNVSGCTELEYLDCHNNQLSSLDLSGCTELENLDCHNNQLSSLDLSGCTALVSLDCYNNQLSSLDLSGCTALVSLYCYNKQLTSLDLSGCTALGHLDCNNSQLTSLDVSGCTALRDLYCYNSQLTLLDVSGCTALWYLDCHNNQLTSLDVSGCTALWYLFCNNNQLTSLNVSGCTALVTLVCNNNQLTSLDVSGCTALMGLVCNNNQLTSLNVSGCTALMSLDCYNNQLSSLDVSGCTALVSLDCYNNRLSSLDVSGCIALGTVSCQENPITQQITKEFERILAEYDVRYDYYSDYVKIGDDWVLKDFWCYNYSDHHGWYYPNEPRGGYEYRPR
ncbi:MAG: leucine-rich repeat domain-containing protein [Alistipes sp.]|nr:leucine-rich repeat domain-containing protein [Alistipes sp.]